MIWSQKYETKESSQRKVYVCVCVCVRERERERERESLQVINLYYYLVDEFDFICCVVAVEEEKQGREGSVHDVVNNV